MVSVEHLLEQVRKSELARRLGRVREAVGLVLESEGPPARLGELCLIFPTQDEEPLHAEVVGFRGNRLLLMAIGDTRRVGPGSRVLATGRQVEVKVSQELLGRVVNGLGRPIDDGPPIQGEDDPLRVLPPLSGRGTGSRATAVNESHGSPQPSALHPARWLPLDNSPPHPLSRAPICEPLPLGIRAIDACLTCGKGQRLGIFSAAGVGKSTLLGMIARNAQCDVNVIALAGERGREVREFIDQNLGPEGLARSVVVVATSDQPPLVRIKCAQVATAIAEYFRDLGRDVLLMMDSVTRVAWAMREVGLAVGEPPTRSGYTPSVFANLPRLMERAGMGAADGSGHAGSITGLYSVLVEGDDMDDPIADTVRGILDGHIVLSRRLAAQGHYPAVDVVNSVSRLMPQIVPDHQRKMAEEVRELLAAYKEAEDLINLGAYQHGSNPLLDRALALRSSLIAFLRQEIKEVTPLAESWRLLAEILHPSSAGRA
jgi:flagellum-specific ATP synthase